MEGPFGTVVKSERALPLCTEPVDFVQPADGFGSRVFPEPFTPGFGIDGEKREVDSGQVVEEVCFGRAPGRDAGPADHPVFIKRTG